MPPKSDLNKAGTESSDFPVLCETCLGPNAYVRMSKESLGAECKICTRPFTVFRWLPGAGMRYKKTEICQTCAKTKNVCQTCLLDLQFGLPTQLRDAAMGLKSAAPTSNINREYYAQNLEANGDNAATSAVRYDKADSAAKDLLKRLARQDPYYNRNKPHLCSFFAKGACSRGDACPYRHELPTDKNSSNGNVTQSIRDRYHGVNDPVARKIMAGHAAQSGLEPPADTAITSLFLTGLPSTSSTTEDLIRSYFTSEPSPIQPQALKSVVVVPTSKVAFVNFVSRQVAEVAASKCAVRKIEVDGTELKVQWGRSKKKPAAPAAPAKATGELSKVVEKEL